MHEVLISSGVVRLLSIILGLQLFIHQDVNLHFGFVGFPNSVWFCHLDLFQFCFECNIVNHSCTKHKLARIFQNCFAKGASYSLGISLKNIINGLSTNCFAFLIQWSEKIICNTRSDFMFLRIVACVRMGHLYSKALQTYARHDLKWGFCFYRE
jgi:hypothetical protein